MNCFLKKCDFVICLIIDWLQHGKGSYQRMDSTKTRIKWLTLSDKQYRGC